MVGKVSLHKSQVAHLNQVAHLEGAYPGFSSMERLGIVLPLDGMLVRH